MWNDHTHTHTHTHTDTHIAFDLNTHTQRASQLQPPWVKSLSLLGHSFRGFVDLLKTNKMLPKHEQKNKWSNAAQTQTESALLCVIHPAVDRGQQWAISRFHPNSAPSSSLSAWNMEARLLPSRPTHQREMTTRLLPFFFCFITGWHIWSRQHVSLLFACETNFGFSFDCSQTDVTRQCEVVYYVICKLAQNASSFTSEWSERGHELDDPGVAATRQNGHKAPLGLV